MKDVRLRNATSACKLAKSDLMKDGNVAAGHQIASKYVVYDPNSSLFNDYRKLIEGKMKRFRQ